MRHLRKLGVELITRTAGSLTVGVAALDHEARLVPVEGQPIVKAVARQFNKCRAVLGRDVGIELEDDVALIHRNPRAGRFGLRGKIGKFVTRRFNIRHIRTSTARDAGPPAVTDTPKLGMP